MHVYMTKHDAQSPAAWEWVKHVATMFKHSLVGGLNPSEKY